MFLGQNISHSKTEVDCGIKKGRSEYCHCNTCLSYNTSEESGNGHCNITHAPLWQSN